MFSRTFLCFLVQSFLFFRKHEVIFQKTLSHFFCFQTFFRFHSFSTFSHTFLVFSVMRESRKLRHRLFFSHSPLFLVIFCFQSLYLGSTREGGTRRYDCSVLWVGACWVWRLGSWPSARRDVGRGTQSWHGRVPLVRSRWWIYIHTSIMIVLEATHDLLCGSAVLRVASCRYWVWVISHDLSMV
jgi:hypothetical protein